MAAAAMGQSRGMQRSMSRRSSGRRRLVHSVFMYCTHVRGTVHTIIAPHFAASTPPAILGRNPWRGGWVERYQCAAPYRDDDEWVPVLPRSAVSEGCVYTCMGLSKGGVEKWPCARCRRARWVGKQGIYCSSEQREWWQKQLEWWVICGMYRSFPYFGRR